MVKDKLWIRTQNPKKRGECVCFVKNFCVENAIEATLDITAAGVYYAELNGIRIGNFVMAPGYTEYENRHQYQRYDIKDLLVTGENRIEVNVAGGWYAGRITNSTDEWIPKIIAEIRIKTADGEIESIGTDLSWKTCDSSMIFSDIYDGEIYDATKIISGETAVISDTEMPTEQLILQEGEYVVEHEVFGGRLLETPKGETVIDFGQNFAGYPELSITAAAGDVIELSFAEILDKDGNFYNENYRTAKCIFRYICRDGFQTYKPKCTFYGFRYIRIDKFPKHVKLNEDIFKGVAVYSDIKQTGKIETSNLKLNSLISNIFWGQRSNFLDIPTDCPQRDERLGWTGDAQVFCLTASYNFNVLKFFRKWLCDMDSIRKSDGYVGYCVPRRASSKIAAGWSDAAVIIPWQLYKTYGDKVLLSDFCEMMQSHVEMISRTSECPNAWRGGANLRQFGDWLATDSGENDKNGDFIHTTKSGATNAEFLQSAFYAYDALLLAKTMDQLDKNSKEYYDLYNNIKAQFNKDFPEYHTQTECAVALRFGLCQDKNQTAKQLVELIKKNGNRMSTGFVGTPHLLHALSENGYTELAYTLLLNENFPSWLYQVNLGATTMWEHWDGIDENGEMWSSQMNSFNHYAYGAVADWIYEVAAGIGQENESAGFESPVIKPNPDKRLGWLSAEFETAYGRIASKWSYTAEGRVRYEITVPTTAKIIIDGNEKRVEKGTYIFVK